MSTQSAIASSPNETAPLLSVQQLKKVFTVSTGLLGLKKLGVSAVDDVSFEVGHAEVLGIVGESGCGKSTTARLLMGLISPDAGVVTLDGRIVDAADRKSLKLLRRDMQMVFQDSANSLNPRLSIAQTIAYAPSMLGTEPARAQAEARDLLDRVGLSSGSFASRYPHELSGGQRQRVNIARALALKPRLVILDEPVAALDKSIEAQILLLLNELKDDLGLSYLFISHDLNVVEYICDRVAVMYLGRIVEIGSTQDIYQSPSHPYTRALLASKLSHDPRRRTRRAPIAGDPPNPMSPPSGCRFRTRCAYAQEICAREQPVLRPVKDGARLSACHFAGKLPEDGVVR